MTRAHLRQVALLYLIAAIISGCGKKPAVLPEQPLIFDVVYPKDVGTSGEKLPDPYVDSTFALGSVSPYDSRVFVNGVEAEMWDNGAFLAWFPMNEDTVYRFLAVSPAGDSVLYEHPFRVALPAPDTLRLAYLQSEQQKYLEEILSHLPARLVVSDSHAVVKTAPRRGYWFFPPAGTVVWADSFNSSYYRISLDDNLQGWIEDRFIERDSTSMEPPGALVHSLSVAADESAAYLKIPLRERLPFTISEFPAGNSLLLELFGVTAHMDQIKFASPDSLIRDIRWRKISDRTLQLEIVTGISQLWGYDAYFEGNALIIELRRPPKIERSVLKNRVIAVDPGHGGDNLGAIGPTRLAEKDANLAIALQLQELLEKKGAIVILTRQKDTAIGLYERIDYSSSAGAEMLLSIHNNAIADGSNPFLLNGSSVYYYHAQSRDLAAAIHSRLLEASGLQDHGLYYKNLALARPTNMLAVLIECAFMIHPDEELLLRDKRFIKHLAQGIVKGLEDFLKQERNSSRGSRHHFYYDVPSTIQKPIWHPLTNQRQDE
ncbi:N-acetylmuramoyl-L-alanine amidase [bacterium]|nr:N-acetylmuramoyl-L-alanine amidase [bacterium]